MKNHLKTNVVSFLLLQSDGSITAGTSGNTVKPWNEKIVENNSLYYHFNVVI